MITLLRRSTPWVALASALYVLYRADVEICHLTRENSSLKGDVRRLERRLFEAVVGTEKWSA